MTADARAQRPSAAPALPPEETGTAQLRRSIDNRRVRRNKGSPPAGNHPVRAAKSSSTNDMTSDGIDKHAIDTTRTHAGEQSAIGFR